jgi:hypothetical protein
MLRTLTSFFTWQVMKSITRLHLNIVFVTVWRRMAPAIAIASGHPFTRTLCHLTTWNFLQSRIE